MRPWLLIPFVLPAMWAGITYADLWPDEVVGWIASPIFAMVVTMGGVALALLADTVIRTDPMRRTRRRLPRLPRSQRKKTATPTPVDSEPLVTTRTPIAQAWRNTTAHFDLRVGMPERHTATPAPRA